MAAAVNPKTGEVLVLDSSGEWTKAKIAQNPQTGEKLYLDGSEWKPVPTPKTQPKSAGIDKEIRDVGLGVRYSTQGLASIPGMAYDAARAVMNTPTALYNMVADKPAPYPFGTSSAQLVDKGLDAAGVPNPETEGGGMMGAVVRGGAAAIPTMGTGMLMQAAKVSPEIGAVLATQPASQVGGSVGSSAAAEYAKQRGAGPITQGVASLGGGIAGAGIVQGAQTAGRATAAAIQPFTQAGRERIAADALLRQSSDPANLRARVESGLLDTGRRLPGSPVTTATAARDPGLMVMEQGLRSDVGRSAGQGGMSGSAAIRDSEARRNATRYSALQDMADDASPDVRGAGVRSVLNERESTTLEAVGNIYKSVDADGNMAIPIKDISATMMAPAKSVYGRGSGKMPSDLSDVLDDISTAAKSGEVADFEWLQNMRSRLGELAGKASKDGNSRASGVFGKMRESLDDGVDQALSTGGATPEQQSVWSWATAARRDAGQKFGRDETGASVVGQILKTDRFGAPMMPDAKVADSVLSNVGNLRQTLSAAGAKAGEVKQQLRGAFVDKLIAATKGNSDLVDAQGNISPSLSAANFRGFMEKNADIAGEIFDKPQIARLEQIYKDFAETQLTATMGKARGSDTAQNVSVGNFIARASNGLIDPSSPGAQTVGSLGGILRLIYSAPEAATREILVQAATDPKFAAMLLRNSSPANVQQASQYLKTTMMDRLIAATTEAGARQSVRTASEIADQDR